MKLNSASPYILNLFGLHTFKQKRVAVRWNGGRSDMLKNIKSIALRDDINAYISPDVI